MTIYFCMFVSFVCYYFYVRVDTVISRNEMHKNILYENAVFKTVSRSFLPKCRLQQKLTVQIRLELGTASVLSYRISCHYLLAMTE